MQLLWGGLTQSVVEGIAGPRGHLLLAAEHGFVQ